MKAGIESHSDSSALVFRNNAIVIPKTCKNSDCKRKGDYNLNGFARHNELFNELFIVLTNNKPDDSKKSNNSGRNIKSK